ncbi:FecR family protein [Glacieibacterium frigidum]|uniref:Iron dicitrate transport regulator FecR n=1 Tax=Glacieibacterium frigidum TaxID=2593303 RepID=A0A552UG74_9SPHN|nr:FecR domain-containing protein [Glacieibacterium frigidum]TRW17215.1 iron dicitrate transport regulator FecR [Glacieibacterium frigidum]
MIREILTLEQLERLGAPEAAALLRVRQDAGGDDHDDAVFDEWIADPANAEAWTRVCGVWASFDDAGDDAGLQDLREAAQEKPAPRQRWGFAIAASLAVVAATGGALMLNRPDDKGPAGGTLVADAGTVQTLTTAKGEHRSFALADASTVTLNTDSVVAVAYRPGGERRLRLLRGQAYFKVAPDKARPFVVAFEDRTVTALGTAFEVRAEGDAMRVVLVEGRVSVSRTGGAPVVMRAGQQLLAGPQGLTLSTADVGAVDDWQRGVVTFRNTTLKAAAAELNRYADQRLVVTDPRVARLTVSGVFRTDDTGRFARTVEAILPVRVAAKGDTLEIAAADTN